MSSSNWRDGEIRELLTITGEKVTQAHQTKTAKDGEIYEKDAEELSLRGFRRDYKTCGQQNKEYVHIFALVNS